PHASVSSQPCCALTGLPLRGEGLARLQTVVELCARRRDALLVLVLHLPDLASLNRKLGVEAVDDWIGKAAAILSHGRRLSDVVFRLDGSTLVLAMPMFMAASVERFVRSRCAELMEAARSISPAVTFDLRHTYVVPNSGSTESILAPLLAGQTLLLPEQTPGSGLT
ncbi:MAG: GGDEF domain-containing protein, partial [Rhodocyclaceae bacterium]|nr:GGDEF domain-containing protein [Rhodocyclaceae bacterium]